MSGLWNEYVRNGQAYSAENFLIGLGGTFAMLQLFNPIGSGVRLRLRTVHTIITIVSTATLFRHDVALVGAALPVPFVIENLLGGGVAAVGQMRNAQPVAALGVSFWTVNALGNVIAIYPPAGREWGHDLLEGQGIHIQGGAGATTIANWQWAEVPL